MSSGEIEVNAGPLSFDASGGQTATTVKHVARRLLSRAARHQQIADGDLYRLAVLI